MGKRAFNLSSTSSHSKLIVPGLKFSTAFHNWSQVSPSFALIKWAFELKPCLIQACLIQVSQKTCKCEQTRKLVFQDQFKEIWSPIIDSLHRCQIGVGFIKKLWAIPSLLFFINVFSGWQLTNNYVRTISLPMLGCELQNLWCRKRPLCQLRPNLGPKVLKNFAGQSNTPPASIKLTVKPKQTFYQHWKLGKNKFGALVVAQHVSRTRGRRFKSNCVGIFLSSLYLSISQQCLFLNQVPWGGARLLIFN